MKIHSSLFLLRPWFYAYFVASAGKPARCSFMSRKKSKITVEYGRKLHEKKQNKKEKFDMEG